MRVTIAGYTQPKENIMDFLALSGVWIGIGLVALGFSKAGQFLSLR